MSTEDFDAITAATLADYQRNARKGFREGTRGHGVSQNVEALLRHIDGSPPYRILPISAAVPGATWPPSAASATSQWDSKARRASSRWPGPTAVAGMATEFPGALRLPAGHFDGIFANASPVPCARRRLAAGARRTLRALRSWAACCSAPTRAATTARGWNGQRYGAYHDYPAWKRLLEEAGFVETGALLPAAGPAARAAALAGERLAAPRLKATGSAGAACRARCGTGRGASARGRCVQAVEGVGLDFGVAVGAFDALRGGLAQPARTTRLAARGDDQGLAHGGFLEMFLDAIG